MFGWNSYSCSSQSRIQVKRENEESMMEKERFENEKGKESCTGIV
jgi:hypothetical protein